MVSDFPLPPASRVIPLSALPDDSVHDQAYWVMATVSLVDIDQPFWYTACSRCSCPFNGVHHLNCPGYGAGLRPFPRCEYYVNLTDTDSSLIVVINGEWAEELLGFTASEILQLEEKKGHFEVDGLHTAFRDRAIFFKLKISSMYFADDLMAPYQIVAFAGSSSGEVSMSPRTLALVREDEYDGDSEELLGLVCANNVDVDQMEEDSHTCTVETATSSRSGHFEC